MGSPPVFTHDMHTKFSRSLLLMNELITKYCDLHVTSVSNGVRGAGFLLPLCLPIKYLNKVFRQRSFGVKAFSLTDGRSDSILKQIVLSGVSSGWSKILV